MKYKIAICDDEQEQATYVGSDRPPVAGENAHTCDIDTFSSAEAFLFEHAQQQVFSRCWAYCRFSDLNGQTVFLQILSYLASKRFRLSL